jgi:hypothetical protein
MPQSEAKPRKSWTDPESRRCHPCSTSDERPVRFCLPSGPPPHRRRVRRLRLHQLHREHVRPLPDRGRQGGGRLLLQPRGRVMPGRHKGMRQWPYACAKPPRLPGLPVRKSMASPLLSSQARSSHRGCDSLTLRPCARPTPSLLSALPQNLDCGPNITNINGVCQVRAAASRKIRAITPFACGPFV